ncbi:sugar phosphate exchanger 3-like [Lineus longissimus]|uniref:sugar phosphate exchanger 3-like n=1 Tax=Lineus longissimus TaxID=88925 RepID=UPI002B4DD9A7
MIFKMENDEDDLADIIITRKRPKKKLSWTHYHISVFLLTFMSYAFFHATRKTFSNVKPTISQEWTPAAANNTQEGPLRPSNVWTKHHLFQNGDDAEPYLGALDAIFLISYAVGLYIFGALGDRFDLRIVLSCGMCLSAVMVFIFGYVTELTHFYNIYFYGAMWCLNGLIQASGWPTVVAVMGNWFGKSSRGFVLGTWSACASVGNIIGAFVVGEVLDYGYEYAFMATSTMLFAGGLLIFFGLVPSPREVGLPEPDEEDSRKPYDKGEDRAPLLEESSPSTSDDAVPPQRPQAIGFFRAFLLPGVILYSLSYACLKLVNYAFFFWLPFYLHNNFGWSNTVADDISIWYDVGGIIGGAVGGFVSDRMGNRSPTCIIFLVCAFPSLYGYSISPADKTINSVLMAVTGFFIGGPANLISSAISADIGRQGPLRGNKEALSTVTGIVDGTGSVGAAIGQFLVPVIQLHLDWHWVFYFFLLMTFMTCVCIGPMFYRDVKAMKCCGCQRRATGTVYSSVQHGLDSPD